MLKINIQNLIEKIKRNTVNVLTNKMLNRETIAKKQAKCYTVFGLYTINRCKM